MKINLIELRVVRKELDIDINVDLKEKISGTTMAGKLCVSLIGDCDRENLLSIFLDTQNNITGVQTVAVGSVNQCAVSIPEILKGALVTNSTSIIIAHNHPAGSLSPSKDDINLTNSIKEKSTYMGIRLLDSIIVNYENYFSFTENSLL